MNDSMIGPKIIHSQFKSQATQTIFQYSANTKTLHSFTTWECDKETFFTVVGNHKHMSQNKNTHTLTLITLLTFYNTQKDNISHLFQNADEWHDPNHGVLSQHRIEVVPHLGFMYKKVLILQRNPQQKCPITLFKTVL